LLKISKGYAKYGFRVDYSYKSSGFKEENAVNYLVKVLSPVPLERDLDLISLF
jgi:hypothetical protein